VGKSSVILVIGVIIGAVLFAGGLYFYFVSGMAPAAVADPPMMFEKRLASRSLDAHIEAAHVSAPPIQTTEENYDAGAKAYKDNCAVCHGVPDQDAPAIAQNMYPHAPTLFKGTGVTDDPPEESYSSAFIRARDSFHCSGFNVWAAEMNSSSVGVRGRSAGRRCAATPRWCRRSA